MTQSAADRWLGVPEGLTREEWWESQTPANFLEGESPEEQAETRRQYAAILERHAFKEWYEAMQEEARRFREG